MTDYHKCARETGKCKGLGQGIKGYHACAKRSNCKKPDREKVAKIAGKIKKSAAGSKIAKLVKKKVGSKKAPAKTPAKAKKAKKVYPIPTNTIRDDHVNKLIKKATEMINSKQYSKKELTRILKVLTGKATIQWMNKYSTGPKSMIDSLGGDTLLIKLIPTNYRKATIQKR